ncbi:MAG: hypothetical protein ACRCXT_08210 [Paraclostridium sp.]
MPTKTASDPIINNRYKMYPSNRVNQLNIAEVYDSGKTSVIDETVKNFNDPTKALTNIMFGQVTLWGPVASISARSRESIPYLDNILEPKKPFSFQFSFNTTSVTSVKKLNFKTPTQYLPDPTTYSNFGYNILTMNNLLDIQTLTPTQAIGLINLGNPSPSDDQMVTPILYNGIIPFLNQDLNYLSGVRTNTSTSQDGAFATGYVYKYQLLTLVEWTRIQAAYNTDSDFVTNFVLKGTDITPDSTNQFINIKLNFTNLDEYVLLVFAHKGTD